MKYNILVLGVGGTGTYFIKEFSRFLASSKDILANVTLTLMDGDTVEKKNLSRQAFMECDIGMNKAEAMASAITEAFGITVRYYSQYLTNDQSLRSIFSERGAVPVIVSCVDNNVCRKITHSYFESCSDLLLLEAGNGFSTGQMFICAKQNNIVCSPLPESYGFQYEDDGGKSREEMSCEELNLVQPQHILANMLSGFSLLRTMIMFLEQQQLSSGFFLFDAHKGTMVFEEASKYGFFIKN